ncbi:hypothetical protein [Lacticaseibacillus songhuajiangensis]|jgi:hypothetical protein|uniref:hypothetical protein n=1 Tax=Lacticaseibacillus songhuajiangensis TaxID=1296539 RepID=UPI000F786D23|nr:hypothetical protein [Lacticaseibacillus songhuajiangensis]MCI1283160.1 hypothetical protein [Lacticaseibacillus songhuajiangensis]
MSQSITTIIEKLTDACATGAMVKLATADKKQCKGTITAVVAGTIQPYADRSIVVVQTAKGIKRFPGYMITKVATA